MAKKLDVTKSSGNVFADLGLPASDKDMLKVRIAMAISSTLEKRGLTQVQAAKLIGTDQAKVSALLRGRLKEFSIERLMTFLLFLGRDIEIRLSKTSRNHKGQIKVKDAA